MKRALGYGGGAIAFAAAAWIYLSYFAPGSLVLLPVAGHAYDVSVDGAAPVRLERVDHLTLEVGQGSHAVRIDDRTAHTSFTQQATVDNSAHALVVPVNAEQCFVEFDFSDQYGVKAKPGVPVPPASERHRGQPFTIYGAIGNGTWLEQSKLPQNVRKDHSGVTLLKQAPCALLDGDVMTLLDAP
jgi:hypothetical protein